MDALIVLRFVSQCIGITQLTAINMLRPKPPEPPKEGEEAQPPEPVSPVTALDVATAVFDRLMDSIANELGHLPSPEGMQPGGIFFVLLQRSCSDLVFEVLSNTNRLHLVPLNDQPRLMSDWEVRLGSPRNATLGELMAMRKAMQQPPEAQPAEEAEPEAQPAEEAEPEAQPAEEAEPEAQEGKGFDSVLANPAGGKNNG